MRSALILAATAAKVNDFSWPKAFTISVACVCMTVTAVAYLYFLFRD